MHASGVVWDVCLPTKRGVDAAQADGDGDVGGPALPFLSFSDELDFFL